MFKLPRSGSAVAKDVRVTAAAAAADSRWPGTRRRALVMIPRQASESSVFLESRARAAAGSRLLSSFSGIRQAENFKLKAAVPLPRPLVVAMSGSLPVKL